MPDTPASYTVCSLPAGHPDYDAFALTVERRLGTRDWKVFFCGDLVAAPGTDLELALLTAREMAPNVTDFHGRTAREVLSGLQ